MKRSFPVILIVIFSFWSCKGKQETTSPDTNSSSTEKKVPAIKDSLSNDQQCQIEIDGKTFVATAENLTAFTGTDTTITIGVKFNDSVGLTVVLPQAKMGAFTVPAGYSSHNTKIAFSEELAVVPTVGITGYPLKGMSFQNLNDGYHENGIAENAVEINSYRQVEGRKYIVKGFIHTRLLRNVYEGSNKENNKDRDLTGKFVVYFEKWD